MNDKLKQIGIPFILMLIFNLGIFYFINGQNFSEGLSPHVGILLISGLLFGPWGAFGAVAANFICDLIRGYNPIIAVLSAIISFGISYLAYKLWYENFKGRLEITKPKLNNPTNIILFLGIIIFCGALYAVLHGKLVYLIYPDTIPINYNIKLRYFLNFINSSFIFGIIGIWIFNKINLIQTPKVSKKGFNIKLYRILGIFSISVLILTLITDYIIVLNNTIIIVELAAISLLIFAYLTKPISSNIAVNNSKSILDEIMNIFLLTILFIILIGVFISYDHTFITAIDELIPLDKNEIVNTIMILIDILLLIFLVPSLTVLGHVEKKVIKPILSFSKIESFIHKNEKIESERLVEIYSEYVNDKTEIGTLARSYTDLINFNNNYIENIREIEGEKERIKAELDIARKIQAANLPTEAIAEEDFIVEGFSKPAKEVGGDFFDYYKLDEDNLAIVIGDASGKGVPAAILAMISQVMIKQILSHERDPSKVLYLINNQLCENNSETMFLTLWLGIYNRKSKTLVFSNAGHNPPMVKEKGTFQYLDIKSGLVLGIMEDFDFEKEEIELDDEFVAFTDGITDANNNSGEMYGEDRLLKFFNDFKGDSNPIEPLLNDIHDFTKEEEQFDDMTLVYLKINSNE